jgi:multiple antibiotic resistance protein
LNIQPILVELAKTTVALFVVVDPIGTVPIVVGLTKGMKPAEKQRNFRLATYVGSVLLIVFALAGQEILSLFGISLYSFMIAGGILLLLISIDLLLRGETRQRVGAEEDIGAVPIAFPLLAGPGAITTTIVTLQSSGFVIAIPSIIIVMLITWVTLRYVDRIYGFLGQTGSAVIAKLMGIFVAAIAIQYVLTGIQFYFPSQH